jgi:hypothetical protein
LVFEFDVFDMHDRVVVVGDEADSFVLNVVLVRVRWWVFFFLKEI